MDDKELLYQMLRREVDNIIGGFNPALRVFSNTVSEYIIKYIDPYVNAFMFGGQDINTEAAGGFIKEEVNEKLDAFIKKFNERKSGSDNV